MFTGLVETLSTVSLLQQRPPGVRLYLEVEQEFDDTQIGDSIAINGCCLTVVERDGPQLGFDAGSETLQRTNLGQLSVGGHVNLERSLRWGDRLGGHLVTGHVDTIGRVDQIIEENGWATYWFQVPEALSVQMASKGSVAVDGVSLTLVDVEPGRFSVALIPHTLQVTTLGRRKTGDAVNIETDILAKYAQRQIPLEQLSESRHTDSTS